MSLWIRVEGGEVFDGDLDMFCNCFFSAATRELIQSWADDNELTVEFEER